MLRRLLRPVTPDHERRALPRAPVAISARLELPSGGRVVQIVDLTQRGGRLRMSDPPPAGAPVLLKWRSYECYGAVIWADDGGCGLLFDQLLDEAALADCRAAPEARPRPAAALDNIRIGARRGAIRSRAPIFAERADGGYAWSIVLPRPIGTRPPASERLPAAEEMFFFGSPLAHVICYQRLR